MVTKPGVRLSERSSDMQTTLCAAGCKTWPWVEVFRVCPQKRAKMSCMNLLTSSFFSVPHPSAFQATSSRAGASKSYTADEVCQRKTWTVNTNLLVFNTIVNCISSSLSICSWPLMTQMKTYVWWKLPDPRQSMFGSVQSFSPREKWCTATNIYISLYFFNLDLSLVHHRATPSSSFTKYSSQSQSQSSRGILFEEDSDDDDDKVRRAIRESVFFVSQKHIGLDSV